mmetsp:Transcript_11091/g.16209  ORF Transcript_11091/g.16209 Transcript_11091/m.16209 type:complete len:213 (-) Transcript_11091:813-1451(-)
MTHHNISHSEKPANGSSCPEISSGVEFLSGILDIGIYPAYFFSQDFIRRISSERIRNSRPRKSQRCRSIHESTLLDNLCCVLRDCRITSFDNSSASIIREFVRGRLVDIMNTRTGEAKIAWYIEQIGWFIELCRCRSNNVSSHACPSFGFNLGNSPELAFVNTIWLVNKPTAVAKCERYSSKFEKLLGYTSCDLTCTDDKAPLSLQRVVLVL